MTRGAVRTALAAIICVVGPFGVLNASQQPPAARVVITHVTIVDVVGGQSHPDMTVVVSRGHIESITESARDVSKTGESNEKIVDARGKFLIPGLWDMHTHMAGINASPTWAKEVLLPLLVANGITGIRDMGGDLDALLAWRRAIESGQMIAPHIVAGGPMLLPARRPGATPAPADPSVLRIGSPEEARDSVDSLQKRGADFIKIIQLPRDSYFAVAEEARKDGISFVGHVPPRVTATEASNAGQKSIEHIIYSNLAFDCSSKEEDLRKRLLSGNEQEVADATDEADRTFSPEKAAALWRTFLRNDTWVTPTLFSIRANAHHPEDSPTDSLLAFLPAALRKEWLPAATPSKDDRDTAAWWERQFANDRRLTREMHRAGVHLLAGSDSLDRYVFVGTSLHEELKMLVAAGLTPLEALRASTQNPTGFLGRKEEGTIARGNVADLVLLEANPLEDISNTRRIAAVVLSGRYLSRADLDEMLAKAQSAAIGVH